MQLRAMGHSKPLKLRYPAAPANISDVQLNVHSFNDDTICINQFINPSRHQAAPDVPAQSSRRKPGTSSTASHLTAPQAVFHLEFVLLEILRPHDLMHPAENGISPPDSTSHPIISTVINNIIISNNLSTAIALSSVVTSHQLGQGTSAPTPRASHEQNAQPPPGWTESATYSQPPEKMSAAKVAG